MKPLKTLVWTAALFFSVMSVTSYAAPIVLMAESEDDRGAGQELFFLTFNSHADLLSGNYATQVASQLNLSADFSTKGLSWDGSQYLLMAESDTDRGAGQELFFLTFDSQADLLAGSFSSQIGSQLNLSAGFSTSGLVWDGLQYVLLAESEADRGAGQELFSLTFDTYADLLSGNFSTQTGLQLNLSADFSSTGLTWNGSQYVMTAESDSDRGAGQELFSLTFDSYADMLAGNFSSQVASQLNFSAGFSSTGLTTILPADPPDDPPVDVAEPGILAMYGFGLVALTFVRRKRNTLS